MEYEMEKYDEWPANYKGDKEPNKKLLKLARKMTDVAAHKIFGVTTDDPEYWGYAEMLKDDEFAIDIMLAVKLREHYTLDQVCALMGMTDEEGRKKVEAKLIELCNMGFMEYDYGYHYDHNGRTAPQSERRYMLPLYVPGTGELFNIDEDPVTKENKRIKEHPDLASFFERMTYIPLAGITQMIGPGGNGVGMHVIPVEKAIELENTSLDIEHLSYWLKKYEGHIGVARCSCRASRKVIGDGCADDDLGWCIGVGDFADYCRETGKGHDITVDEAIAILKRAEENGFVHQVTNIDGDNKVWGICNCNVEICNALRTSQLFNTPNLSRSAYVAHVDKEKCVACGRCVEYCPAGAVKLGQKLCNKNGKEFVYPRQELPDNRVWGKDKWNFNYRDDNRINTHTTGTAPCKASCPAHIAVQGYLKKASQGKYREALALIKKQNPFPAVCGRVCNRRCEDACTRGAVDQAIAIDAVKKFIAEQDLNAETRYIPEKVLPMSIHRDHWEEKIAIIGGGPAGLTAAFYLAEKGYYPTVFEKNQEPGGMLRYGIPSYKLGKDVLKAEIDVIREMGVEIRTGVEVGKDITLEELRKEGYKAFYIAIGCSEGRKPGVPGEDAEGVTTALEYLREANCGGKEFTGRVVVVGGGNVAIDAARVSRRNGASSVQMLCLENEKEMPASLEERTEAKEDGVQIQNSWGPKEVLVKDGKVKGIVFKKCLSVFNEEHRFAPKYNEEETITIECDRVIFAVGQASYWGDLLKGEQVVFQGPRIQANSFTYQTDAKDIFVGGDVYTGPKFAIDAIAAGKVAAESLHRYVQNGHMELGRNRWQFEKLDRENISLSSYDNGKRNEEAWEKNPDLFKEAKKTFTEEQVKAETARCLGCGVTVVDPNKCLGCGVCTTKCAFSAITLHRDRPECSTMMKAEDKFSAIIPYELKRIGRIAVHYTPKEEKDHKKAYREFLESQPKSK